MRAEVQNVTGEVEREPTVQAPPSEDQSEQYSLAKILGENLLRLSGMDVEETRQRLANAS